MIRKKLTMTTINLPVEAGLPPTAPPPSLGSELRFPFGKLAGWAVLFVIGGMFVYRLSETGGRVSRNACLAAMIVSSVAAVAGIIPVLNAWGRKLLWVILSVFLSGAIRLLIGLAGVVIIILFTAIERTKFVGFLALFYTAFLAVDIWLSLWVLRHTALTAKHRETAVHGNK